MAIPAEFFNEEGFQVKVIQELTSAVAIYVHQSALFSLSLAVATGRSLLQGMR